MIYEVFRRERQGAAMQHAGSIAAPDGRFAAADGLTGDADTKARLLVLDPLAGRMLWTGTLDRHAFCQFTFDVAGDSLWYGARGPVEGTHLIRAQAATRKVLNPVARPALHYGPRGELAARPAMPAHNGVVIFEPGREPQLVHLGVDVINPHPLRFDSRGARLVWGQSDGSVMVADLAEVRRRLTAIGLGCYFAVCLLEALVLRWFNLELPAS